MYQKEVIYMGLYKEESRMGSAGFLKVENRERESRLYMKIQNVPLGISGRFPVRIYNGNVWKEINGVTVQDGKGNWEERFAENVDQTMVQVILPGGYVLKGKSRYALEQAPQRSMSEHEDAVVQKSAAEHEDAVVQRSMDEQTDAGRPGNVAGQENMVGRQNMAEQNSFGVQRSMDGQTDAGRPGNVTGQENMVGLQNMTEQSSIGVERGVDRQIDTAVWQNMFGHKNVNKQENEDEQNPDAVQRSAHTQNCMEQQNPKAAQEERQRSTAQQNDEEMRGNVSGQRRMDEMGDDRQINRIAPGKTERNLESSRKTPQTIIITEELPRRNPENDEPMAQSEPGYHLKEDKWEQLLDTYEQIHPYGDDRVYIKIEPRDFVILQSNYQHLVNNSFLLHGFYNYRYIILGKEQDHYYLGVPGVFYEREKMVALMFGFEAFECPGGNVGAGEFGYYLRKVEL